MPMRSEAQRKAMYAASSGKSTVGIPKKVADEFAASDKPGKLPERASDEDKEKSRYGKKG